MSKFDLEALLIAILMGVGFLGVALLFGAAVMIAPLETAIGSALAGVIGVLVWMRRA